MLVLRILLRRLRCGVHISHRRTRRFIFSLLCIDLLTIRGQIIGFCRRFLPLLIRLARSNCSRFGSLRSILPTSGRTRFLGLRLGAGLRLRLLLLLTFRFGFFLDFVRLTLLGFLLVLLALMLGLHDVVHEVINVLIIHLLVRVVELCRWLVKLLILPLVVSALLGRCSPLG